MTSIGLKDETLEAIEISGQISPSQRDEAALARLGKKAVLKVLKRQEMVFFCVSN